MVTVDLGDPTTVALLAVRALDAAGIRHAIYGGLLLAAYGEARETRDADLAVIEPRVEAARDALGALGLDASVRFADVPFGGLSICRITLLPGEEATGLSTIDLVQPRSPRYAAEVLRRSVEAPLRDGKVHVVSPEDFVVLKALSTRDRDIEDAASVLHRSGSLLDLGLVEREVDLLGSELPEVDVRRRLQEILRRGAAT